MTSVLIEMGDLDMYEGRQCEDTGRSQPSTRQGTPGATRTGEEAWDRSLLMASDDPMLWTP